MTVGKFDIKTNGGGGDTDLIIKIKCHMLHFGYNKNS